MATSSKQHWSKEKHFLNAVKRAEEKTIYVGDCWIFTGKTAGEGKYACIWFMGKMERLARLVVSMQHKLTMDKSWYACHELKCNSSSCWNPMHLRPDTAVNNVRDQIIKGTFVPGTKNLKGTHARLRREKRGTD